MLKNLTEAGALTNSYRYDSYGTLTSGTPDAVNYYGYNAESTNTNTGYQYLRARYYHPETGTFTTEDSDLGTTKNPLTRNRYSYTANNPLNYTDPTGHSLWSRFTGAVKSVTKKVTNSIKTIKKFVSGGSKSVSAAKASSYSPTKASIVNQANKKNGYSSQSISKYGKRSSNLISRNSTTTYYNSKFFSWVWNATEFVRANVIKELCNTDSKAEKQEKEKTGTLTFKFGFNANLILGYSADVGVSIDRNGNFAIQYSDTNSTEEKKNQASSVGVADIGVGFQLQVTNAKTVYDLEGYTEYYGVSGGVLGYGGVDLVRGLESGDTNDPSGIYGVQVQVGVGVGLDAHVSKSYGETVKDYEY